MPNLASSQNRYAPPFFTQRICCCNPDAPEHWLKKRADEGRITMIESRHIDNPSVTEEYLDGLRRLTGHRRARLYEGKWVGAEGVVFPEFDDATHVIDPFDIGDWPVIVGWDPGYDHPTAILFVAIAPNECYYVVDEIYCGGKSVEQHCRDLLARIESRRFNMRGVYGDPQQAFSRTAFSSKTISQQAYDCGITMSPWPRTGFRSEAMVNMVRTRLINRKLKVFASCKNTLMEFRSWSYKRARGGELPTGDDQFEDRNNHAMDALRGLVSLEQTHARHTIEVHDTSDRYRHLKHRGPRTHLFASQW